jgi:hypothetical protein
MKFKGTQKKSVIQQKKSVVRKSVAHGSVAVGRKPTIRKPWSPQSLSCLKEYFKTYLNHNTLPLQKEFLACMKAHPAEFEGRKWTNLKDRLRHYQLHGK